MTITSGRYKLANGMTAVIVRTITFMEHWYYRGALIIDGVYHLSDWDIDGMPANKSNPNFKDFKIVERIE